MSITTKLFPHSLIGIVSVLPALLVMPALAGDPYTSGDAFIFGDVAVTGDNGTIIDNMAVGGRRTETTSGGKYLNAFPGYNMYGRSLTVTVPETENATNVLYVGPVNLTLGSVEGKDFRYNFQKDIDTDGANDDIDIATYGPNSENPIVWNEELNSLVGKVANIVTSSASDVQMSAGGVYMYSRLDPTHYGEGALTLEKTVATIDGAKVNANTISVTDGSSLTISKDAATALNDASRLYTTAEAINSDGEAVFNADTITLDESRIIVDAGAGLTMNATNGTSFTNSSAENGGAIYIGAAYIQDVGTFQGSATINSSNVSVFDNNTAESQGGAIYNYGTLNINNAVFTRNKTTSIDFPSQGGAIFNSGDFDYLDAPSITSTISNTIFGDKNDATKGNQAVQGGAIANESDLIDGEMTLTNVNFYNNKAFASDNNVSSLGGAIWNEGIMTINGDTEFKGNTAEGYNVEGGAIYNSGSLTFNDAVVFDSNTSTDVHSGNGAFGGALSTGWTSDTLFKKRATFTGNKALSTEGKGTQGGAIFNGNTVTFEDGATFSKNEAVYGGAVFNEDGTMTINDGEFTNNKADDEGGAIFNYGGTVNINAVNSDVLFSGNTASGILNDITNYYGDINFDAATGRSITLNGIDGPDGNVTKTGAGTLNVSEYIAGQTVDIDEGELHLTTGVGNLYQSTVSVASGATINTQDDTINAYGSKITLADGAKVKADANATAVDTFTIASGDTVTLNGLKLLADLTTDSEARSLATAGNVSIDDTIKVFTTANKYDITGNTADNGQITLTKNGTGGLSLAASSTTAGTRETVSYSVTGDTDDTSVAADVEIKKADVTVTGAGTGDGDTGITLAATLSVDENSSLTADNAKFEGAGSIDTAAGAGFTANNSKVDVDVNNAGDTTFAGTTFAAGNTFTNALGATTTLLNSDIYGTFINAGFVMSDPTTIYGLFDNSGTANFDADTFAADAELRNTGTVNLDNGVTFASGAEITGDGLINLASGTTHFNDTASSNTVNLASGADFDGVLASTGVLNTQNSNIDTITGSVSGGDLYVDANTTAGTIDTFANTTGATIRGINLANAGYGTAGSVALDMGGASLGNDVQIEGINYYTKVFQSGNNVVFGDKLMNTSGMYAQLGSWNAGNYIGASSTYDPVTASYTSAGQTVGGALTALDTAVKNNADAFATKANVAGGNTFTGAQTITNTSDVADAVVNGLTVSASNTTDSTSNVFAVTSNGVTINGNAVLTTESALNGAKLSVGSVGTTALADDAVTLAKIADGAMIQGTGAYATSTQLTTKGYVDQALAASTANTELTGSTTAVNLAVSDSLTVGGNAVLTTANKTSTITENSTDVITSGAVYTGLAGKVDTTRTINGHALTSNVTLDATDVLTDAQQSAVNSGITADKVNTYDGYATTIGNHTTAINTLNGDAETAGSVDYKIANAITTAVSGSGAVDDAIDAKIEAAVGNGGAVTTAVATATTMGTGNTNFNDNVSVTDAVAALDTNIGKVHGLVSSAGGTKTLHETANATTSTNVVSGNYVGNLAVGTTIEDHLIALDNSIGALSTMNGTYVDNNASVATNLMLLDNQIAQLNNGVTNALSDARAYTDNRVESLDKNMSSGIAGAVALSSVAVSGVERGEVSVGAGYGYFNGQSAAAVGAAMGLSNRWSVNAGAGISNADVSFRAGTNYKFKLF